MPRGPGPVFKALLQQQKSIILGIAEMKEGFCMWNHLGINGFVGMATESHPNSRPLSLLIVQEDLSRGAGDGFLLQDKLVCAHLCWHR